MAPGVRAAEAGQCRGGPTTTGHASHQTGLDGDFWFWLDSPANHRKLTGQEVEELSALSMLDQDQQGVDPKRFQAKHVSVLEYVSKQPEVARIFVNPLIKKAACEATDQAAWLNKLRPWWGHHYHFHVRLHCPAGQATCKPQSPPPESHGCGKELAWWFSEEAAEKAGAIIAIGSCASWGGIPSADPNPTGAVGAKDILTHTTVVTIPGCPANPYNFLGTVLQFAVLGSLPALDDKNRPLFAYGRTIHEHCPRRAHFDAGRFAQLLHRHAVDKLGVLIDLPMERSDGMAWHRRKGPIDVELDKVSYSSPTGHGVVVEISASVGAAHSPEPRGGAPPRACSSPAPGRRSTGCAGALRGTDSRTRSTSSASFRTRTSASCMRAP